MKEWINVNHFRNSIIVCCLFLAVQVCSSQNGSVGLSVNPVQPARGIAGSRVFQENQFGMGLGWSQSSRWYPHSGSKLDTVPSKTDSLPQHTEGVSTVKPKISYRDSAVSNIYGDLLDDDPIANPRSPVWVPILETFGGNVFLWSIDKFVSNEDFSNIGFQSWKRNIKVGWEWDSDAFEMNHFFHPYGGSLAFDGGRANGYSFFESAFFSFGSSLMWEYFGENTLPSYNDQINTTLSGMFGGEILYRLSSNVLDDRTTGAERFFRELLAAAICPKRGFTRFVQGRLFRVSSEEVYQKEPLNVTFSLGEHNVNNGSSFGTGSTSVLANAQFVYGNPFEDRTRKPFDFFNLRFDMNFGAGDRIIDNITGYGLLYGSNGTAGNFKIMTGVFQHFDYWDNTIYQFTTLAFGGGIVSQLPILKEYTMETTIHMGLVPLGAVSSPNVSVGDRNYDYSGGVETKFGNVLDFGWGSLTTDYFLYWLRTYVGAAGYNVVSIFKPRFAVHLYRNMNVGFEYLVYQRSGYFDNYPTFSSLHTEQKIYFTMNLENFGIKD